MNRNIVPDVLGRTDPLPADENGRPLDAVAASWWDGGFRVAGYVPPPTANFDRYIAAIEAGGYAARQRQMRRNLRLTAEAQE